MKDSRGDLYPRTPPPFCLFLLSAFFFFFLSLSSFSFYFLFNPGEQSTAEVETAELSSTLIRDRGSSSALTTLFDPSNRRASHVEL